MRNRRIADLLQVAATLLLLFASFFVGVGRAAEPPAGIRSASGIEVTCDVTVPPIAFAAAEIRKASTGRGLSLAVILEIDPANLGPQCYRIERMPGGAIRVTGGDAAGAMYGGLDVAEALHLGTVHDLAAGDRKPHVERRGLKFNIPLDLRTPSYSDCSDAAQANIPEMWSMDFWREMLDEMARHRFNVLSLWSLHPFPSIVKVPEYPDVALDDVWRTRATLDTTFSLTGSDMVRPAMLADFEIVKKITIDEKIRFWQDVLQHAADRGIEVYWFTWNIFVWGTDGKYDITIARNNPATIAYFRASVRETVRTYPLLAGIGITAGEQMGDGAGSPSKEQWLWQTYGEGIRDALADQPERKFRLIHRFHQTGQDEMLREFKDFPGEFDLSFKYSIAHMYSLPNPPFIQPVLQRLPPGLKTWLTVRNDDIYSFRWGDPEFARQYVLAMPDADHLAGFYMGPDGYCWGREFIDREPRSPRQLVIQKQWYSFMLWGRLSYDPAIGDSHFQRVLAGRFPDVDAAKLFAAVQESSRIIPLVSRFYWENLDFQWFPEACISHPRYKGFHTVQHFMTGRTVAGSGIMTVRQYVDAHRVGQPARPVAPRGEGGAVLEHLRDQQPATTPLDVARQLRAHARAALDHGHALDPGADRELRQTLGDAVAMAHLGNYYAAKIEGAVALYVFDKTGKSDEQTAAVASLEEALNHWRAYAAAATSQYHPQRLNRIGHVDLNAVTAYVEQDVNLAKEWQPGTLAER